MIPVCYISTFSYMFILCLNVTCAVCIFFAFGVFLVPFLLHEFRLDQPSYKSIPALRSPDKLILAYRAAQILLGRTISVVSLFMFPTQCIVYKMVVFTSYMMLKHGNEMDTMSVFTLSFQAFLAAIYWSSTLVMGGNLHAQGKRILLSWKYHNKWPDRFTKRLMGKFRVSCKPFQLNWGKTYTIKRLTVLKFLRSLSRGILKALLAL